MNNTQEEKSADEFLLTFADLVFIIKRNKKTLRLSAIACALLALSYGLLKPMEYEAEGTFKEKGKSQSGLGNSLTTAFFLMSDNVDSNALTMMRSRILIENLIKEKKLQGMIAKKERLFPLISFQTIKNNLFTEYALFKNLKRPIVSDPTTDFTFEEIDYEGEVPKNFEMKVLSKEKFLLYDEHHREIGEGVIGQSFSRDGYSFTLSHTHANPVVDGEYSLALLPLEQTALSLSKKFKIETDRQDKNLLKITYKDSDRKLAADNVNTLMTIYQKYIACEHELICEKQVGYLVQRQKEMANVLETMMKAHANELSLDLSSTGFATSAKAMDFLAVTQQELKHKLFTINLEIQRLERAKSDAPLDNDAFSSVNNLEVINKLATEKRLLKQQADSLSLVLRNLPSQSQEFKESFALQLNDIEEIKQTLKEAHEALASLNHNEIPHLHPKLVDSSKYIFKDWHERLRDAKESLDKKPLIQECLQDWEQCKTGFVSYLSNLTHFLNVYQRNIEERLAHQQAPLKEFQGINLNIARDLYISYNKELSNAESLATQHEFIYNQLNEPNFEISSLSTILTDPLSLEMITRTSNLILALKDQDNRSSKEQERLNADLVIQKGFLKTHIQQSIALLALRQQFLKEKIQRVQSLNLSLTQEQISILENQIKEYITSTLENLIQEKELIEKNLAELRIEMGAFPQKWAAEQMIDQQMEINKTLVEEISNLVESKNISNNLEKFQSAPVDIAFPPIHPKSPRILLLTMIGAFGGAFISFIWILGRSVVNGVKASEDNLKAAGQQVSGSLSRSYQDTLDKDPLLDNDLATLRRLIAFIDPKKDVKNLQNTLLLLEGKGPDYSAPFAELLALKGLTTIVLELHFEEIQKRELSGILQYLEGKTKEPEIHHLTGYDKIMSGGICRYANELIGSQRFKDLLGSLTKQYDWVIISSSASPKSAEAESLLDLFPLAAVTITEETLNDLKTCIQHANDRNNKVAFILGQ